MRRSAFVSIVVLTFALAASAAPQLEEKPAPMDKAPFHIPVFQNDYIILLNVNIPPGRNTGYHTHYADSVSVNLMPASQTNQNYGSNEVSAPGTGGKGEPGRATFTDMTKNGPRTHKATNVEPGQSTGQITQSAPGLRVYVHGGVLAEIVPGNADRGMAPYDGDFIWKDAGETRSIKNTGTTRLEFVEFEFK